MHTPLLALSLLLPFLPPTLSIPTSTPYTPPPAPETWPIPLLSMHMMTPGTGLPGGVWPAAARFNSSIAFAITMPHPEAPAASMAVNCSASFMNGTLPLGLQICDTPEDAIKVAFLMEGWAGEGTSLVGRDIRRELRYRLLVARWIEVEGGR